MKTYYNRAGNVYVEIDSETKQIINVLIIPTQKTISIINNIEYYNMISTQLNSWTLIDEITFKSKFDEVLNQLNNL